MSKVHVFAYSQIVETNEPKTVENFAKKTQLSIEAVEILAMQEKKVGGSIYKYMINDISSKEFRSEMNTKIKGIGGSTLDDKTFDCCWNVMCTPQSEAFTKLYKLQDKYQFSIHAIGRTNEMQHKYIQNKIKEFNPKPNITYTVSFEAKTLDIGKLEQAAKESWPENCQITFHNEQPQDAVSILMGIYNTQEA